MYRITQFSLYFADQQSYSLQDVAKLHRSERIKEAMEKVQHFSSSKTSDDKVQGPVEADPEYILIVEANNLAAEIDDEIGEWIWNIDADVCQCYILTVKPVG